MLGSLQLSAAVFLPQAVSLAADHEWSKGREKRGVSAGLLPLELKAAWQCVCPITLGLLGLLSSVMQAGGPPAPAR